MADRKQGAGWSSGSSAARHKVNCSSCVCQPAGLQFTITVIDCDCGVRNVHCLDSCFQFGDL